MKNSKMKKHLIVVGVMACVVLAVAGCSDKAGPVTSSEAAPVAAELPAPSMLAHLYAVKDGDEYGYEQAISEADRQQGKAASSLMMFSYLGRKGDTYQVMLKVDEVRTIAECTKPCEFAKIYTFVGTQFMNKEMLKLTPAAIVAHVFADAVNGQLEPMMGEQRGVATTFWVDGDGKKLVVADAKTSGVTR